MEKRNMKNQKVTGWWVYVVRTPNNMYYPGCSNQKTYNRWRKNQYKTTELYPYIEQYGWENLEKIVLKDELTKEQALYWEDRLICMYRQLECCINKKRSGGDRFEKYYQENKKKVLQYRRIYYQGHKEQIKEKRRTYYQVHKDDVKEQQKNYYQTHKEEVKQYQKNRREIINIQSKEYRQRNEQKIYNRVRDYNRYYPDKITETPLEAKQKYLETGYIPTYIKNNDIN